MGHDTNSNNDMLSKQWELDLAWNNAIVVTQCSLDHLMTVALPKADSVQQGLYAMVIRSCETNLINMGT